MDNMTLTELTVNEMLMTEGGDGGGFGCFVAGGIIAAGVWTLNPLAVTVGVIMLGAHC